MNRKSHDLYLTGGPFAGTSRTIMDVMPPPCYTDWDPRTGRVAMYRPVYDGVGSTARGDGVPVRVRPYDGSVVGGGLLASGVHLYVLRARIQARRRTSSFHPVRSLRFFGACRMLSFKPFPDRWWYAPPWKVTRPWLPRVLVFRNGGDEFCNPTAVIVFPLAGDITVRYRRGPVRTMACDQCQAEMGPWCKGCTSCHHGPRCHVWGFCDHTTRLNDCPKCRGLYCQTCETNPEDKCPTP